MKEFVLILVMYTLSPLGERQNVQFLKKNYATLQECDRQGRATARKMPQGVHSISACFSKDQLFK